MHSDYNGNHHRDRGERDATLFFARSAVRLVSDSFGDAGSVTRRR